MCHQRRRNDKLVSERFSSSAAYLLGEAGAIRDAGRAGDSVVLRNSGIFGTSGCAGGLLETPLWSRGQKSLGSVPRRDPASHVMLAGSTFAQTCVLRPRFATISALRAQFPETPDGFCHIHKPCPPPPNSQSHGDALQHFFWLLASNTTPCAVGSLQGLASSAASPRVRLALPLARLGNTCGGGGGGQI